VVSRNHLFQASLELFRQQKGDSHYLGDIGHELSTVYEAIGTDNAEVPALAWQGF